MQKLPSNLVPLLRRAAAEMLSIGETPYLGSYDTCAALGRFLDDSAVALASGRRECLPELWAVFAPTSEWDDAGGSQATANAVFALLERLHHPAGT